jgi:HAD superfamily hydrolase (TIGR01509 family)
MRKSITAVLRKLKLSRSNAVVHQDVVAPWNLEKMPAIIFDMDETLVATGHLWRRAEDELLKSVGSRWTQEVSRRYKGMNALDLAAGLHRELEPPVPLQEFQQRMRNALIHAFRTEPPNEMPGAVECIQRMAAETKIAMASGSPYEAIDVVLQRLELREFFAVIVSSESVARGKPHPDVFLEAARRLDVGPADCVVIEDTLIGAKAARAAGMRCLAVPSEGQSAEDIRATGATIFSSLHAITWYHVTA